MIALWLACGPSQPPPMSHEAYVWQRVWTPALARAWNQSAPLLRGWRVLAGEIESGPTFVRSRVERSVLAGPGRSVTAVFRVDRAIRPWPGDELVAAIRDTVAQWRAWGVPLSGVEIDYDCATSQLDAYRAALLVLRGAVADLELSITVLPTWLMSDRLGSLLGVVDRSVLQVHSVLPPGEGLFDPERARRWVSHYARVAPHPFLVALPTYGSRVSWDRDGRVVSVTSEGPGMDLGTSTRELVVPPERVAALVQDLPTLAGPGVAGVAWFRLPTADDVRSWRLETWHAVIEGRPLSGDVRVEVAPVGAPGGFDLRLVNPGPHDRSLPRRVDVTGSRCSSADALPPYELVHQPDGVGFERSYDGLLAPAEGRALGWVRCAGEVHVRSIP